MLKKVIFFHKHKELKIQFYLLKNNILDFTKNKTFSTQRLNIDRTHTQVQI